MNNRNIALVLSLCCFSSWAVSSAFVIPTTRSGPVKQHLHHEDYHLLIVTTSRRHLYVDPNDAQHAQATPAKPTTPKKTMTEYEFHRALLEERLRNEKKARQAKEEKESTAKQERVFVAPDSLSSPLQLVEESPTIVSAADGDIDKKIREETFQRSLLTERLTRESKERQQKSKSQVVVDPSKITSNVVIQPSEVQRKSTPVTTSAESNYDFQRSLLEARLKMEARAKEKENMYQVVGAASILASSSTTANPEVDVDDELITTNNDSINDQATNDEKPSLPSTPQVVIVEDEEDVFATRTMIVAPPSEDEASKATTIVSTDTESSSSSSYEFQRSLLERRLQMEKLAKSKKDESTKVEEKKGDEATLLQDSIKISSLKKTTPVPPVEPNVLSVAEYISDEKAEATKNDVIVPTFGADGSSDSKAKRITSDTTASKAKATKTAATVQTPIKEENVLFEVLSSIKPSDVLNTFTPDVGIIDLKEKSDDEIIDHVIKNFGNAMKYGGKAVGDTAQLAFLSRSPSPDVSSSDLEDTTSTAKATSTKKSRSKDILDAAGKSTKGVVSLFTAMTALLWKKGGEGADYFDQLQKERAEEQRKAEEARKEAVRIEEIERRFQQQVSSLKEEMDQKRQTQESFVSKEIHNVAHKHKLMIDEKAEMALSKALREIQTQIEDEQDKRLHILQNNKDDLIAQKSTLTTTATPKATTYSTPESRSSSSSEIPFFAYML